MREIENTEFSFIIHSWMLNELNLKGNDLLLYALIYTISQDGKSYCRQSRIQMGKILNITPPTVDKSLNYLIDRGLIEKFSDEVSGMMYNYFRCFTGGSKNFTGYKETLPGDKEILPTYNSYNKLNKINNTTIKTSNIVDKQDNKEIIEDNRIINKGNIEGFLGSISTTKQQKDLDRVDKFLTQYKELSLPEVRVINDSRKKAILHILNTFTEEQVLTVLKNFSKSDFLLGKCSSFKANIDWILKESNFIKILEGNYNNNYSSNSARADNAISETYTEEELKELERIDEERRRNGLRTKF